MSWILYAYPGVCRNLLHPCSYLELALGAKHEYYRWVRVVCVAVLCICRDFQEVLIFTNNGYFLVC